jgi:GDSL-like Lipase/Acylhydrolase
MVKALDLDLMRDSKTPQDVELRFEARKPVTDPTLGIVVNVSNVGTPQHRLVTIGDSLTHGFQSGAIFNTQLSYPAIIAKEMGWGELRYPNYNQSGGGLPFNLEKLANDLQERFGSKINWLNTIPVIWFIRKHLDVIEDYWERGKGTIFPSHGKIYHNLAVYGWDLRNTISRNADICLEAIAKEKSKDDILRQVVDNHNDRAAACVLNTARDDNGKALTTLQAAAALGTEGNEIEGIETLVVMIGANNTLGAILTLNVNWSDEGYDEMNINDKYTVWRPTHFKAELDLLVADIKKIRARHVILATVPHITIVPLARGVGGKVRERSRYFPYYTLPWIEDKDFNPTKHPHITENEVRAIDSAIDQYNDAITEVVRQARQEGRDWYLFELCGLLDRLASRRYLEDPTARPDWWNQVGGQYQLASALKSISPPITSEFFHSDTKGRTRGGLFSLDGIHPTTIGYGIMAQEVIKVMQLAGVKFYESDGKTEREGEIKVDFQDLIARDTLISQTPRNVDSILDFIGGIDKNFNLVSGMMKRNY